MQGFARTVFENEFTSGFSAKDHLEDITSGEVYLSGDHALEKSKQDFIEIFDVESLCIAKMDESIEKGKIHFAYLFSYRSCGRVCTQFATDKSPMKNEINIEIYNLVKPNVDHLIKLMNFCLTSVHTATEILSQINSKFQINNKEAFIPSIEFVTKLSEFIGLLMDLDNIKNIKVSEYKC